MEASSYRPDIDRSSSETFCRAKCYSTLFPRLSLSDEVSFRSKPLDSAGNKRPHVSSIVRGRNAGYSSVESLKLASGVVFQDLASLDVFCNANPLPPACIVDILRRFKRSEMRVENVEGTYVHIYDGLRTNKSNR